MTAYERDDLGVYFTRALTAHGASTGVWRNFNLAEHVGDEPTAVAANRALLERHLGCPVQWLKQVHGTDCHYVDELNQAPVADAAWTEQPDLALAVLTADCVPVVLAARQGAAVAVVHAGWRGLKLGILPSVIETMACSSTDLSAWIGPHISTASYEVGEDVWSQFDEEYLAPHALAQKRYLNMAAVAESQLRGAGVTEVMHSGLCTYEDSNFFSHRRHQHAGNKGNGGRFATLVVRRG
eukprot:g16105.t1